MNAIKILLIDTKNLQWKNLSFYTQFVSKDRQDKIDRLQHENDKILSLTAGLLAKYGLPENAEIDYNNHGKPLVKNIPDLYFSLSHSKNLVAFVKSTQPVGIDTELISQRRIHVQKRFFTENENHFIEQSNNPDTAFFRIWTAKEAYVKMIGTGLSKPLSSFDVTGGDTNAHFYHFFYKKFIITVCTKQKIPVKPTVKILSGEDIFRKNL